VLPTVLPTVLLALVVGLTACGSSSDAGTDGSAPGSGGPSSPKAVAADPAGSGAGTSAGAAGADGPDPCRIVTSQQVAALIHRPVKAGKPDRTSNTVSCTYSGVSVGYFTGGYDKRGMLDLLDQQQKALSDKPVHTVAVNGVGNAAAYVPGLGEVVALKGDRVFYVIAWTGKDVDSKAVGTALAKRLVAAG